MEQVALRLSFLVLSVSGYLIKIPTVPLSPIIPNVDWLNRERLILPLFDNVCDQSTDPLIVRLSQEFTTDGTNGNFKNTEVLTTFKNFISGKGLLPKGEIFTEYNTDHVEELHIISGVLLGAQDFSTFLKAAAWARQNTNCGLYVDAIYLAMIKRIDTQKLSIPAPYELLPNYFIKKDVIIMGSTLLTKTTSTPSDYVRDDGNAYIIDANYTSDIIDNDDESKLAYFHEDIGLNSYYFLKKLTKLPWFKENSVDSKYGEFLFHCMKQLATRYDLERYANGFGEVQSINWDTPNFPIYDSMLIYSNGNDFDLRKPTIAETTTEDIHLMEKIEDSITTVVDHMRQSGLSKSQIVNNLIDMLVTGTKNYESMAHQFIGSTSVNMKSSPSVLEHFMTSPRDPLFWKLNKKIVELIETALSVLPTYSRNELYFPGVEVLNVEIKKMQTYYENFEFDVTNALKAPDSDSTFQVKISQPRLNHKPLSVKVNISSIVSQKGLLKIYLGPKMMPGQLAIRKSEFMLLDYCEVDLKKGNNIITRSSEEIKNVAADFLSLKTLFKNVEDAQFGLDTLPNENIKRLIGFPSRLVIPKGLDEGLPLEIFVFVAPFVKVILSESTGSTTEFNSAIMSPGYPLDLTIENWQLFDLPNAFVKEVIVTHKDLSKPGNYEGEQKKYGGENTYDYSSKKGQYGTQTYDSSARFQKQPYYTSSFTKAENIPVHRLLGKKSDSKYAKNKSKKSYTDFVHLDDPSNVGGLLSEDSLIKSDIVEDHNLNTDYEYIVPSTVIITDQVNKGGFETKNKNINKVVARPTDVQINNATPGGKNKNDSGLKYMPFDEDNEMSESVSQSTLIQKTNVFGPLYKIGTEDKSVGADIKTNEAIDVNMNSLNPWIKSINKSGSKDISVGQDDGINRSISRSTDVNVLNPWVSINKSGSKDISFGKDDGINKSVAVNLNNLNPWAKAIRKGDSTDIVLNINDGINKSFARKTDVNINSDISSRSKTTDWTAAKDISIDKSNTINKSFSQAAGGVVSSIFSPLLKAFSKTGSKTINIDDDEANIRKNIRKNATNEINGSTGYSTDIEFDDKVNKWSKTIHEDNSQDPLQPSTRTFDITKNLSKDYSNELNGNDNQINIPIESDKDKARVVLDKEPIYLNDFDSTKLQQETPTTKRRPSFYDYVLHGVYDDYYDEPKVYQ